MMSGLPRVAARERAAEVLRHVGLAEERYRPMGGYSTGMKQRAKLAQALAHDPRLVLLDEPTNGLDPAARDDMLGLVQRVGQDFGISVLVTSHLLGELERVSDHVVILDSGRLLRASRDPRLPRRHRHAAGRGDRRGRRRPAWAQALAAPAYPSSRAAGCSPSTPTRSSASTCTT